MQKTVQPCERNASPQHSGENKSFNKNQRICYLLSLICFLFCNSLSLQHAHAQPNTTGKDRTLTKEKSLSSAEEALGHLSSINVSMSDISTMTQITLFSKGTEQPPSLPLPSEENAMTPNPRKPSRSFYIGLIVTGSVSIIAEAILAGFAFSGLSKNNPSALVGWLTTLIGGTGFMIGIPALFVPRVGEFAFFWWLIQGAVLGLGIYTLTCVYSPVTTNQSLQRGRSPQVQRLPLLQFQGRF